MPLEPVRCRRAMPAGGLEGPLDPTPSCRRQPAAALGSAPSRAVQVEARVALVPGFLVLPLHPLESRPLALRLLKRPRPAAPAARLLPKGLVPGLDLRRRPVGSSRRHYRCCSCSLVPLVLHRRVLFEPWPPTGTGGALPLVDWARGPPFRSALGLVRSRCRRRLDSRVVALGTARISELRAPGDLRRPKAT